MQTFLAIISFTTKDGWSSLWLLRNWRWPREGSCHLMSFMQAEVFIETCEEKMSHISHKLHTGRQIQHKGYTNENENVRVLSHSISTWVMIHFGYYSKKTPNKQKDYCFKSPRNGYLAFQIISCLMYDLKPIMIHLNWVKQQVTIIKSKMTTFSLEVIEFEIRGISYDCF